MPFQQTSRLRHHYLEHGRPGAIPVLFIHGNLGCGDWISLALPHLPDAIHLIAPDWRGCGDSDKPEPDADFANYSMTEHADDMLALLDALEIGHCHLATHSTGDFIASHMLLRQPERFGRVLSLSPVGPMGLAFTQGQIQGFAAMRDDPAVCWSALATAVSSLFQPETLGGDRMPAFRDSASEEQRHHFRCLVDRTRQLSDGIWLGTPVQLTREHHSGGLRARQAELSHPRLILWGEHDAWIPRAHMEEMRTRLPDCRLEIVPGVGHSMNVEDPGAYARALVAFLLA
ncbi:MAG: alpha/beta hydrolase [Ectothiorhodospiraceae bacterium]|nr:alpha/beta hydrolase [Ectothiorhodospiraceae bacterium]